MSKKKISSYEEEWGSKSKERKEQDKAHRNKKGRKNRKSYE